MLPGCWSPRVDCWLARFTLSTWPSLRPSVSVQCMCNAAIIIMLPMKPSRCWFSSTGTALAWHVSMLPVLSGAALVKGIRRLVRCCNRLLSTIVSHRRLILQAREGYYLSWWQVILVASLQAQVICATQCCLGHAHVCSSQLMLCMHLTVQRRHEHFCKQKNKQQFELFLDVQRADKETFCRCGSASCRQQGLLQEPYRSYSADRLQRALIMQ